MSDAANDQGNMGFKDRKTGLVVFGIFQILGGVLFALMISLTIDVVLFSAHAGNSAGSGAGIPVLIPAIAVYAFLSIWNFSLGIGSIKARRWARALLLISSWVWLLSGVVGFASMAMSMQNPDFFGTAGQKMPAQFQHIAKIVALAIMTVFYIVIPGVMILFYGSRHVKATCEQRDPVIRWTDKCPLPVLGLSLVLSLGLIALPFSSVNGYSIPFFGIILNGVAGTVLMLVNGLVIAYMAWGIYKLKVQAWWCALVWTGIWFASGIVTFTRMDLMDLYEKMNLSAQKLESMRRIALPDKSNMLLITSISFVIYLLYLLYVRKFFIEKTDEGGTEKEKRSMV